MSLSKESEDFLGNLRIYLISSGKNEKEVDEIVGELEDHLVETEKRGKSVAEVTGLTPREYMDQISGEMPIDYKSIFKYIVMVLLGALSFIVLGDALSGDLEYSLFVLIGYPLVITGFLFCTAAVFKYVSSHPVSKVREWTLFLILGGVPMVLLTGLLFLSQIIDAPTVAIEGVGEFFALALAIAVLIGVSLWSKTWMMIILAVLLNGPEMLIQQSSFSEETKLILTGISLPVFVGGYFVLLILKDKKKEKQSRPVM
ncbi:hypothetical protein NQ095_06260 [Rossellomorea sp. SC111]|uniref:HAAS domain-containing protein n=1 Tax=Rossellomorea sp. SC111 TaxID=2968985 RepID=UPI00215B4E69|nr:hypothetical protein [Rossellomorea sp. SC111]MCR8848005.1 hypothetical protein [Rossellomorea sp. SC111]